METKKLIAWCEKEIHENERLCEASLEAFGHDNNRGWISQKSAPFKAICDKLSRYENALRFYADKNKTTSDLYFDAGNTARKALEEQ